MRPVVERREYGERIPLSAWQGMGLDFMAHWHPEVELCLVTAGRLRVGINGLTRDLEPGWLAVCGSNDIHHYQRLGERARHEMLIFRPELADYPGVWPPSGHRLVQPFWPPEGVPGVVPIIRALIASPRAADEYQRTIDRGLVIQLCGLLDRHATAKSALGANEAQATWRDRMIRAIEFIRSHSHEDIALDDVARAVNLSQWHFSRSFAASSGQKFTTYLKGVRLERADDLLASGNLTMLEVALTCGFGSVRSFNRAWRELRGSSPARSRDSSGRS